MNVLIVSSFLPFPLTSGGHVRLYNILKSLAKNHTLFLVCEKRDYQTQNDIEEIKKICKEVIAVERKKQWSIGNILKTGFSTQPFLITGHTSRKMEESIASLLQKEKIDVIHAETFYIMQNIPLTEIPIVLVEHNIEYLVYQRFISTMPFFMRPLLWIDILKLKSAEERYWRKATQLVAVSEEEKQQMGLQNIKVVANGVDIKKFQQKSSSLRENEEKTILFIGDFKWIQNKIAIKWLLTEIWPIFSQKIPAKLWIVGRNIPHDIRNMDKTGNVVFDENAPKETQEIFGRADVLISPVKVGGGTSFKVLEAMASGVPVVTTNLGIEGIKASPNKEFLLANTTEGFVQQLIKLISEKKVYTTIADNARLLIEKEYAWEKIVAELESIYKEVVKK